MAALLTSETGNTEKVVKYIREARDMSITVLPPDVNSSDLYFTPVGEAIRFGLAAIKNVGENTVRGILEAREKLGGFRSLFQFCDSVDARLLNRRVLESLIKSGAMDSLGGRRAQLFAVIDRAMERAQKFQREQQHRAARALYGRAARPPSRGTGAARRARSGPSTNCWRRNSRRWGFTFRVIRLRSTPRA